MAVKLKVSCERCGLEHTVERASRFSEQDYYELWHDYMNAEADLAKMHEKLAEALADIERLRFLIERLEAPQFELETVA